MPAVTRELLITYAGVTIGGTSDYYLIHADPPYRLRKDYTTGFVQATVICRGATESEFNTKCAALEAAYRTPNGATTITIGSTDFLSLSHSSNTGFLARPTIEKPGSEFDSARARLYVVTINLTFPADLTGKSGLRVAEVEVSTAASGIRSYRVSGEYTALSSNSAVAQYEASIAALLSSLESDLTGTWERTDHGYSRDDENKVVRFRRTGVEIIYAQSSAGTDHASIKSHNIIVTRAEIAPGDSDPTARRPVELLVYYEASIDKSQTTDLPGLWESTIEPWLITTVRNTAGASAAALTRSAPIFDHTQNRISATLEVVAVTGSILARTTKTTDDIDLGKLVWPVWDGTPLGAEVFDGKVVHLRIARDEVLTLGGLSGGVNQQLGALAAPVVLLGVGGAPAAVAPNDEPGFVTLRTIETTEPRTWGLPRLNLTVTQREFLTIKRRVDPPAGNPGGNGNGTGAGFTTLR